MAGFKPEFVISGMSGALDDPDREVSYDMERLPFNSVLSLIPLVEFWERTGKEQGMVGSRILYERINRELQENPELLGRINDVAVLAEHQELLDLLMMPVFPPALRDNDISAALVPFESYAFYATPAFKRLLSEKGDDTDGRVDLEDKAFIYGKTIAAYLHILKTVYGLDVPFEFPLLFSADDPETGLERHFKITSDLRFLKVKQVGDTPALTREMRHQLLADLGNLDTWARLIPPQAFELYGFDIIHATDVTDVEVVSLLERDLLEGESMLTGATLPALRNRVRALLRQPQLHLGLAAVEDSQLFLLHKPNPSCPDCLFKQADQYDLSTLHSSVFGRVLRQRRIQVIEDLAEYEARTAMEEEMLEQGAKTLIAAPLLFQGNVTGVLYLWTDQPGEHHALNVNKLQGILPLFSAALKRGREEVRSKIQAVILNKYTAIHPSVEWRFRQAALNFIRRQEEGEQVEVEPIVFQNVYPLYAATDIRGSSTHRNEAVMADLQEHLVSVVEVLRHVKSVKAIPLLDYLTSRTEQHIALLNDGLSSGDEANIRDFLRNEINPVLKPMQDEPGLHDRLKVYFDALDPTYGRIYRRHREFDESVTLINRTISTYLEDEEQKAQAAFPHYFEKHQTDGVEFTIYAGASLLEHGDFDELYVRNLRLWQLITLCGIARKVEPLRQTLTLPLETTHLVLTQSTPLAIRFRFDETRFDVDGTHHIRYEIMKQRIEKALLRDRDERLTQPGKIAIVYSQAREAWEYSDYIRFLQQLGYLTDEVEDVELSDLQGMTGLKALRVTVALKGKPTRQDQANGPVDHLRHSSPAHFPEALRN